MFALLTPLALTLAPIQDPVASSIQEVTVFPGTALVRRAAELPAGGGEFVIEGLPWSMDPESVRVRCVGGDVVGIETRERHLPAVTNARIEELRGRLEGLERELLAHQDELDVLGDIQRHLKALLEVEASGQREDVQQGRGSPESWAANIAFLSEQLFDNRAAQRDVRWRIEALQASIEDVRLELGRGSSGHGEYQREVIVRVVGQGARGATLDVEYLVANAGWRPLYDLRTASDALSVELSYRAQVWQQSGEDWVDATLLLSTARPRMGAQGPEPEVVWIGLQDPRARKSVVARAAAPREEAYLGDLEALGYTGDDGSAPAPRPFAAVENEGLSVRFRLASRETVESRQQPTTVLVGQSTLEVTPEYYAVPALDENVWLRGRTTNSSDWTLLPGRAAVYFGADFIGHAELDAVQPGEELTLHLGSDPGLTVERVRTEDLSKEPGFLGSRVSRTEGWRLHLENHGAAAPRRNGSARVIVHEVLPRSRDERLEVTLLDSTPKPSEDERWKEDRDEKGILTWIVDVPRGGQTDVTWRMRVAHPKGTTIYR